MELQPFDIFSPSQEITDPKWFAGRVNEIETALTALSIAGSCLMVFGDRGIGKTSFVEMIKQIVSGNNTLIFKHKLHNKFHVNNLRYSWISVECNHDMTDITKVLQSLITSPNGIKKFINGRVEKEEKANRIGFSIGKILGDVFGANYNHETKQITSVFTEENSIELFSNLILEIDRNLLKEKEGLLIIIDEFDLVQDKSKFASLIKTLSKNKIKFLISGIAESYDQLIASHSSIQRNLFNGRIKIDPMTMDEMTDFYNLVTHNSSGQVNFNKQFIETVYHYSHGYPYYVQLFGYLSVKSQLDKNKTFPLHLNPQHLRSSLKSLMDFDPDKDIIYSNLIGTNPEKELALKLLASNISKNISQKELFSACQKRNISSPKGLLSSMLSFKDPVVLRRVNTDTISFTDPIFKIYANARKPEFLKEKDGEFTIN